VEEFVESEIVGEERRGEVPTQQRGEEGSPDSPCWPSRRLTQGPTPALCFAFNLCSLSPVHCAQVSSSSCCHLAHHYPFRSRSLARSLARSSVQVDMAIERRASGEHRIRWVDAYESLGVARKRVRFSCMLVHAESRRPNPHKSVALPVQERPFLAALVLAEGPAERTRRRGTAGRWEARPSPLCSPAADGISSGVIEILLLSHSASMMHVRGGVTLYAFE